MSNRVLIFDTTLRDGEQALAASLTVKEKLQIALALERLGVDVMEVGFPVSSPGDFHSVQTIAKTIKNSRVCALSRALEKDIDAASVTGSGKNDRILKEDLEKGSEKKAAPAVTPIPEQKISTTVEQDDKNTADAE